MKSSIEGISYLIITMGTIGIIAPIFGLGLRGFDDIGSSQAGFYLLILGFAVLGISSLFKKKEEQ